ncbi:uncharacterized protein AB675_8871 [Cyphellophora attinorum]|uniref:Uncharacterized protein n=1 Tax=Cyphellophora attinorum TaxID=1664694 RepID=A0A0N0NIT4_9EURO|nr:uncharacterized protein AB675_8871 [Phialophora attinorum]KPI36108.1 hypothetical protein AB675_8871 [Phialophora attinorum]
MAEEWGTKEIVGGAILGAATAVLFAVLVKTIIRNIAAKRHEHTEAWLGEQLQPMANRIIHHAVPAIPLTGDVIPQPAPVAIEGNPGWWFWVKAYWRVLRGSERAFQEQLAEIRRHNAGAAGAEAA